MRLVTLHVTHQVTHYGADCCQGQDLNHPSASAHLLQLPCHVVQLPLLLLQLPIKVATCSLQDLV